MGRQLKILLATIAALAVSTDAEAQTDVCSTLQAQLNAVDQSAGDYRNNDLRDTETAISRKRDELDRTMTEARRAGCYGGLLFKALKPAGNCRALTAKADRARAGLSRLESQRRQFAGDPYATDRQRSDLMRQLAANGCDGGYATYDRGNQRRTGLFASLFGGGRLFGDRSPFGGGTYRTLCVRSCDGYYFPISFATTPDEFGRDENTCRSMCPGSDASLYVYRNPGGDPAQMVSLAGAPYTALPNAFRYRREYDKACTCPPISTYASGPASIIGAPGGPLAPAGPDGVFTIATPVPPVMPAIASPLPRVRPDETIDPETAANQRGGFVPGEAAPTPTPDMVMATAPNGKRVRVVGPDEFYVTE
jgi:Protein of unknown function (DUF2865)